MGNECGLASRLASDLQSLKRGFGCAVCAHACPERWSISALVNDHHIMLASQEQMSMLNEWSTVLGFVGRHVALELEHESQIGQPTVGWLM